mgnify:CR=1 FL=1
MKKSMSSLAVAVIAGGLLAACSTDKTTSYIDPDFRAGLPADWRIVTDGTQMDLNTEEALIAEARDEFSKIGQTSLSSIQIIPPTRDDMPGEERLKAFENAGGEVVLEITRLSKDTNQRYSSGGGGFYGYGGTSTTVVRERGLLKDRTTVVATSYPVFYHDSFYATTRTDAAFRARLIDVKSGKVIWQSDSSISRSTSRDTKLAREAVEEFVKQLVADGVIRDRSN